MVEEKVKIVLITTGQPSCNPRIVKEADAFCEAGHDVTLLYSFFIDWAQEKDIQLLSKVAWKHKLIGGVPCKQKWLFNFTRIRFKIANVLNKYIGNHFKMAELAQARAYDELLKEAKKIKADWYIGHNLGTLSIAVKAAKHNNAKSGFDFEDYHRGETTEVNLLNRYEYLEKKYLYDLSYYSTASNLISEITAQNHPSFKGEKITLLNCFSLKEQPLFCKKNKVDKSLKLFWFSQTVGLNRGLEILLKALIKINNPLITLTIAGRLDDSFSYFIKNSYPSLLSSIDFIGIIEPEKLPFEASNFDVGLALETVLPINRDLCLTNKVFTYLLAGNAIIYSNTKMQSQFNETSKSGISFHGNNIDSLIDCLNFYLNRDNLLLQKQSNYAMAKERYNWELESKKLLAIVH